MWNDVSAGDSQLLLSVVHVPLPTLHGHRHCRTLDLLAYVMLSNHFHPCTDYNRPDRLLFQVSAARQDVPQVRGPQRVAANAGLLHEGGPLPDVRRQRALLCLSLSVAFHERTRPAGPVPVQGDRLGLFAGGHRKDVHVVAAHEGGLPEPGHNRYERTGGRPKEGGGQESRIIFRDSITVDCVGPDSVL